jgi:excisionase family DNA binding protein
MSHDQNLLTIEEAARFLNVSKISLRRWTNSGRLRCFRVGVRRERRFLRPELEEFLADPRRDAAEPALAPAAITDPPSPGATGRARAGANHISMHFRDPVEQYRMLFPYLLRHVRLGAPVLYIYDTSDSRSRVLSKMRGDGIDPEDLARRGLLRMIPASESYLRDGSFSADRMLVFIENAINDMLAGGTDTALITGEMSWCLSDPKNGAEILDYERRLNGVAEKYPHVTTICQYCIERFEAAMTLDTLCAHALVELPDRTVHGYFNPQL